MVTAPAWPAAVLPRHGLVDDINALHTCSHRSRPRVFYVPDYAYTGAYRKSETGPEMEQEFREPPWSARIVVTATISALCGMFALPAKASLDVFWTIQLYAQCIGFAILACNTLFISLVVRPIAASSGFLRLVALIVALPIGYEIGTAAAAFLHGDTVAFGAVLRMPRQVMLIMVTSAIAVILLFGSHWRIVQSTAARLEAQRLATEVQLRLLQAQLEPHMLFNTLANLHSLIEVDAERAQLMVEHLIEFMRCTLSASRQEMASLQDEFTLITAYLKLMEIRMGPRLSFVLVLPDSLAQARLPTMLLQPLVENAIKHGLEPKVDGGTIRIEAEEESGWLQISVRDTGVGLSKDMSEERYGIRHVQERLRVLYGDRASLSVQDAPAGGVQAVVRVPR